MTLFPLTHPQKRIWYVEQINPGTSMFNIGGAARIKGEIDFPLLKKALRIFIERNQGLRLRIVQENDIPYQYVAEPQTDEDFEIRDFSKSKNPEEEYKKWTDDEVRTPFALFDNPLYRIRLFRISPDETGYMGIFHHIVSDGYSITILTAQVTAIYENLKAGRTSQDIERFDFLDQVEEERKYLASERFKENRRYWTTKFEHLPEKEKNSPEVIAGRKNYEIENGLTKKIKEYIAFRNISLNTFYTAIFLIYLYKMSGAVDQIIGIPVLNRIGRKERNTFGMFTSSMPIRIRIDGAVSFEILMKTVANELMSSYKNQKYPYDLLAKDLALGKKGYGELFTQCVNYYNVRHTPTIDGFCIETEDFFNGSQAYSQQLVIREWSDTETISLSYDFKVSEYSDLEMESMHACCGHIIEQVLSDGDIIVDSIALIPQALVEREIYEFNSTLAEYPCMKSVDRLIDEQAEKTPAETAICHGKEAITFAELRNRSDAAACRIRGMCKGETGNIVVTGRHSIGLITGILGTLKAGCTFIPVDPQTPTERLRRILKESGAGMVLTDNIALKSELEEITVLSFNDADVPTECERSEYPPVNTKRPAYIIYTSGSTGTPKGVVIGHASLVNYLCWARKMYVKDAVDAFAFYSSISFDLTITSLFTPLICGSKINVYDPYEDDERYVLHRVLDENRTTIVKLTPSHLQLIKDRDNAQSAIHTLIVGGENLTANLAGEIRWSFAGNVRIFNEYGPTEATVGCMIHEYNGADDGRSSVPIGRPIDNCKIYVLDGQSRPLPAGCRGEINIGGACLAEGYFGNAVQTAERFVDNPFVPGEKMYKTGDYARFISEDCVEYLGRQDDQVKIRGNRVELGEIERAAASINGVGNAVVMKREKNGTDYLCAYLLIDGEFNESRIREDLSAILPEYMIPAAIVPMTSFPLTHNGKIDRRRLPEPAMIKSGESGIQKNVDETGHLFLATVQEVLGLENVSPDDDFYQLGGDSIKAIQISSKMRNLGYSVKVKDLLDNPIIGRMFSYVFPEGKEKKVNQELCRGDIDNTPILSWFFSNNFENPHYYNQSVLLELKRAVEKELLEKIVRHLVGHHDVLRANYSSETNALFYNDRHTGEEICIPVYDVSGLKGPDKELRIRELCEELKSSFDIETSLLFAGCLFKTGDTPGLLFLTAHHLVIDGVSWRILLDHFAMLHDLAERNVELRLPPKTDSYRDWAISLQRDAVREAQSERTFWDTVTAFALTATDETMEHAPGKIRTSFSLSEEYTGNLLVSANVPYRTKTDELLIIALVLLVSECTKSNTVVLEMESHGRQWQPDGMDISGTIGWFTALYPLKLDIVGRDMNERIKSLKEQIRKIPGNGFGFGILKYFGMGLPSKGYGHHLRFNYLGDFSHVNSDCFEISPIDHGIDSDVKNRMSCACEINASVMNRKLTVTIDSTDTLVFTTELESFARKYADGVKEIIDFCLNKGELELTPSDFTDVNLSQEDLDALFG